jgi:uncharacterized protein involved in outer membrane biogenesis
VRRRRLLVALALAAALAAAAEWAARRLPMEARRAELERALAAALGREVRFAGEFRLAILPRPRLEATQVRVASPPGGAPEPAVAIERLELELALWPLLRRRVDLVGIEVEGAEVRLEPGVGAAGASPFGPLESTASLGRTSVRFRRIELRGVRVGFAGEPAGAPGLLRVDAAELSADDPGDPIEWKARGELRGAAFELAGSAGSLAALAQPSALLPLALEGQVGEAELRVSGRVPETFGAAGLDLEGELESERLRLLEQISGRALPEGSLRARFRLREGEGALRLEGAAHLRTRDGKLRLDLEGSLADLVAREQIDATLRLEAPDLATLARAASPELSLPPLAPVAGSARLRGGAKALRLEQVRLEAGRRDSTWIALDGSLANLAKLSGVRLDATFEARHPGELLRALGVERTLPELGAVSGRARVRDPGGRLGIERLELRGGTPGTLELELRGGIEDLRRIDALAGRARLEARDLGVVATLFGAELPALGPVAFEGEVRGSDERLESEGSAQIGSTRFDGRSSLELAGRARPRLEAELHSPDLRLEDLGFGAGRETAGRGAREPTGWASREPLPFEMLRRVDLRLRLRADRLRSAGTLDVGGAQASLELEDGRLQVSDLVFVYQGGRVAGALEVDARAPEPEVLLGLEAAALDLAGLAQTFGSPVGMGSGQLDLRAELRSRGASPASLREGLGGRLALALRDWTSAAQWVRRFLLDVARVFFGASEPGPERVGCLVAAVAFEAGVGSVETLVLSGPKATVVGAGRIDLAREEWNLELVPQVHDPRLVLAAPAVRVTGPLAAPRVQPVPLDLVSGALRSIARTALAPARLATGGARRVLGPAGRLLAPVEGALGLGTGAGGPPPPPECALPPARGASGPG